MKNHIQLRKNVYTYPAWVVSFQGHPVGRAHSRVIAQVAADTAAHYARMINPANCCPSYLIKNVTREMAARDIDEFWTAEIMVVPQPKKRPVVHLLAA